uniref:RING finger protein 112 n=1 Tax=Leptobrachium leishanense TaxID=445787 RepID=A0A8C5QUI7_9ANUR
MTTWGRDSSEQDRPSLVSVHHWLLLVAPPIAGSRFLAPSVCPELSMGNSSNKPAPAAAAMPREGAAHFHKLEEDIMCSICLHELQEPVSIACGHTFCRACISSYWSMTQLCGYRCPECRSICPKDQLIPVHRLRNLVTKVQLVKEELARKEKEAPVHLVYSDSAGKLQVDDEAVTRLFLSDEVSSYPACLICVIGEKRRGKSFLLNYILRALSCLEQKQSPGLGSEHDDLEGFGWEAGTNGVTKGIWIWSRPFILERAGEKMAVYVVDTEGSLDLQGDRETSIKLSALSMVLSSYLIFNVSSSLKTTEMDYLEVYLHISELTGKSFLLNSLQHLDILVRDWHDPEKCGRIAGREYIDRETETLRKRSEHRQVFETLRSPSVSCSVLPNPGKGVVRPSGKGRLSEMDEDFRRELTCYITELVRGVWKHRKTDIHGEHVTCVCLGEILKEFVSVLRNEQYRFMTPAEMFCAFENQKIKTRFLRLFEDFKESEVLSDSLFKVLGVRPQRMKEKVEDKVSHLLADYEMRIVNCGITGKQTLVDEMKSELQEKQEALCAEYSKKFTKCAVGVGLAVGGGVLSLAGGVVGAAVAATVLAAEAVTILGSTTATMVASVVGGSVAMGAIGGGVGAGVGKAIGQREKKKQEKATGESLSQETTTDTELLVNKDQ